MPACNKCNEHRGIFELDSAGVCKSCRQREEREWKDDGAQSPVHPITITTANSIPGIDTYEIVDIVTAECAFGMNLFRDMFAGVRDIFGGRSGATQKVLRDARTTALDQLRREAHTLGANAIIGVDLDYSEFSGGRKSMLFIVASGTAIKTKSSRIAL